jgi:hypothetical protein
VDAVAPAIIGLGIYLMYEAYKNKNPTPIAKFKAALAGESTGNVSDPTTTVTAGSSVPGFNSIGNPINVGVHPQ